MEEGGDHVKSLWLLWKGLHMWHNAYDNNSIISDNSSIFKRVLSLDYTLEPGIWN